MGGWVGGSEEEEEEEEEVPVALATRFISSEATRPAQKSLRSAKYWVARSPIGS